MARSSALARAGSALAAALVAGAIALACSSPAPKPTARPAQPKAPDVSTQPERPEPTAASRRRIYVPEDFASANPADLARAREKGWTYMIDKLVQDGVSPARAARAFADPRMPAFDGLLFGITPREPSSMYRGFLRESSQVAAERCAAAHAPALRSAERLHGVDAAVVAAIMHVETHCGRNTGRSMVLHRLARLAMANEPRNVARNLARNTGGDGRIDPITAERVRDRARYLEGIFYPQVVATFEIARQERTDPIAMRGSGAGAFGYVQFLPMNFVAFGTDANGDGRVSLYDPADAIASAARFLASYGWKPGIKPEKKRQVIWHYNRSDAYIDTVLMTATRIRASGALDPQRAVAAEAHAVQVQRPATLSQ